MSFKEWFYGLFEPPCLHQWDKVAELRDKPKNATAATLIRMCRHCGEVSEITFRSPTGKVETCPPHTWAVTEKVPVYAYGTKKDDKSAIPHALIFIMKCERCGEMKQKKMDAGGE